MSKKIKVLVLADHPFSPSGVGTQTRYMIEGLLASGQFSFVCFGGAVRHEDYSPQKWDKHGDDLVVFPVDGYGTQEAVRSIIRTERPDMLWFMTDPRFFPWLWEIEDEIRSLIPMVYYHVWDNYPYPDFNKTWYNSSDVVVAISKVTHDIVKNVSPEVESHYLPHAVNPKIFKPLSDTEKKELREKSSIGEDKFVVFWNNRNARRKHPGTLIFWFKEFLDRVGHDSAQLLMHTDPHDPHGPDLNAVIQNLGLTSGQVMFSTSKLEFPQMAALYNIADVTVNISDAEGFGLSTLESLSSGTPIIVNMTGGLKEQVTDGEEWFGVGIEPCSKAVMSAEERKELGQKGVNHVEKNYNFQNYVARWRQILEDVHKNRGCWKNRKKYNHWELMEV